MVVLVALEVMASVYFARCIAYYVDQQALLFPPYFTRKCVFVKEWFSCCLTKRMHVEDAISESCGSFMGHSARVKATKQPAACLIAACCHRPCAVANSRRGCRNGHHRAGADLAAAGCWCCDTTNLNITTSIISHSSPAVVAGHYKDARSALSPFEP